jgi:hypothetical protein
MTRRLPSYLDVLPAAAVLLAAAIAATQVPYPPLRSGLFVVLAVLAAVTAIARGVTGPAAGRAATWLRAGGLAVIAADMLATVGWLSTRAHPTDARRVVLVVWTVLLAIHLILAVVVTARRFPFAAGPGLFAGAVSGLTGLASWAVICLIAPGVPGSNSPALVAVGLSALAAAVWSQSAGARPLRILAAGLTAAVVAAFGAGAVIDGVLPWFSRWVTTSAPPVRVFGPLAPHRLVDPVGLLMLSGLLALVLLAILLPSARRPVRVPATAAAAV